MVTWAFAKLGHFDPVLTKALAERTTVVAADLSQMDLGQLCWGLCAAIDHEAKAVGVSESLLLLLLLLRQHRRAASFLNAAWLLRLCMHSL